MQAGALAHFLSTTSLGRSSPNGIFPEKLQVWVPDPSLLTSTNTIERSSQLAKLYITRAKLATCTHPPLKRKSERHALVMIQSTMA